MSSKRASLGRAAALLLVSTLLPACDPTINNDSPTFETTIRVSVGLYGAEANEASFNPSISADGRFIVFESRASNLHADDADTIMDIFVRDVVLNTTTLVSRATGAAGAKGNAGSFTPSISGDGRFVAFESLANNLDPDDFTYDGGSGIIPDPFRDIYVRDLVNNTTLLVSRFSATFTFPVPDGAKFTEDSFDPRVSRDGQFVAFCTRGTSAGPARKLVRRDIANRVSAIRSIPEVSPTVSTKVDITADGQRIAFSTTLSLNAGDPYPGSGIPVEDVYLWAVGPDTMTGISRATGAAGVFGNAISFHPRISQDGQFVAYVTQATNLIPGGADSNGMMDVYVRDTVNNLTSRISVAPTGVQADGESRLPGVSGDGSRFVFASTAANLVPGDSNFDLDCFLALPAVSSVRRISVRTFGSQAIGASQRPAISSDGRWVVFDSNATDMVGGDLNGASDIFLRGPF